MWAETYTRQGTGAPASKKQATQSVIAKLNLQVLIFN
jgi:hypothetical protein